MTINHGTCAKDSVRKIQSCDLGAGWVGLTEGGDLGWGRVQFWGETRLDVNSGRHSSVPTVLSGAEFLVTGTRDLQYPEVGLFPNLSPFAAPARASSQL